MTIQVDLGTSKLWKLSLLYRSGFKAPDKIKCRATGGRDLFFPCNLPKSLLSKLRKMDSALWPKVLLKHLACWEAKIHSTFWLPDY